MEFCPKCEVRLKKNNDGLLSCLKCNYVKEKTDKSTKEKPEETESEFLVMGEDDMNIVKGLESTVKIDCEKCHNQEGCLLYTSDAADDTPCVDLGGRRIIKKK